MAGHPLPSVPELGCPAASAMKLTRSPLAAALRMLRLRLPTILVTCMSCVLTLPLQDPTLVSVLETPFRSKVTCSKLALHPGENLIAGSFPVSALQTSVSDLKVSPGVILVTAGGPLPLRS